MARAPALQAGGHRFDSDILHKEKSSFKQKRCDLRPEGRQVKWFETDTSALIEVKTIRKASERWKGERKPKIIAL